MDNEPQPQQKAQPKFVGGKARSEVVLLEWPLEYDGQVWSQIEVRRVNAAEVQAFVEAMQAATASGTPLSAIRLPMFDAPQEVLDALDQDDAEKVDEVVGRFLPRSFRDRTERKSPLPTGEAS